MSAQPNPRRRAWLLAALVTVLVLGGIGYALGSSGASGEAAGREQGAASTSDAPRPEQAAGSYQRGFAEGQAAGRRAGTEAGERRGAAARRRSEDSDSGGSKEAQSGKGPDGEAERSQPADPQACGTTSGGRRLCGEEAVAFCNQHLPAGELTAGGEARCRAILSGGG